VERTTRQSGFSREAIGVLISRRTGYHLKREEWIFNDLLLFLRSARSSSCRPRRGLAAAPDADLTMATADPVADLGVGSVGERFFSYASNHRKNICWGWDFGRLNQPLMLPNTSNILLSDMRLAVQQASWPGRVGERKGRGGGGYDGGEESRRGRFGFRISGWRVEDLINFFQNFSRSSRGLRKTARIEKWL
jgi:hypothetical protein